MAAITIYQPTVPSTRGGPTGVFSFIAFAMVMVILVIGVFGPRTYNRAEIS
jgi:hypothetical protein